VAALAAVPPVRAVPAPASRVRAALLDQHLGRALVPSCGALRRRAPWAHGNDLQAPGDDSRPCPPPPRGGRPISTSCPLTCAALRAGPARSIHVGRTARWHPDRTGVPIVSWTRAGLPGGGARRGARTATSGGRAGGRVMDAGRVRPGADREHGARAPGGVLPGAGLPGGLALTTARADGPRSGRGAGPAVPPCHAVSWRPCTSPAANKATRSRRSKSVAAPPELVSACFQRPESVSRCQPLGTPAFDGQGAPVRFARVRFAAAGFARARLTPGPCLRIRRPVRTTAACTPGRAVRPGVFAPGSFGGHCPWECSRGNAARTSSTAGGPGANRGRCALARRCRRCERRACRSRVARSPWRSGQSPVPVR
jgi:hypothetical protein